MNVKTSYRARWLHVHPIMSPRSSWLHPKGCCCRPPSAGSSSGSTSHTSQKYDLVSVDWHAAQFKSMGFESVDVISTVCSALGQFSGAFRGASNALQIPTVPVYRCWDQNSTTSCFWSQCCVSFSCLSSHGTGTDLSLRYSMNFIFMMLISCMTWDVAIWYNVI